jgi:hypothetical protein
MDVAGDPAMLIALSVSRFSSARFEIGCRLPASRQAHEAEVRALPAPSGCFDSTRLTLREYQRQVEPRAVDVTGHALP